MFMPWLLSVSEDVLRHVKDSGERAAHRVRSEMLKEREMTSTRLRRHYIKSLSQLLEKEYHWYVLPAVSRFPNESGPKTINKKKISTQNKYQTQCARAYKLTSFLSTDCELSTETCSKNVYSPGPWSNDIH